LRVHEAGFPVLGVATSFAEIDWPAGIVTTPSLEPAEVIRRVPALRPILEK
jgi:hypothetical protein